MDHHRERASTMLKKIRRNSKQLLESRRSNSVHTIDPEPAPPTTKSGGLTFFDLPAEIRNAIYEDVARQAHIRIPLPSKKNSDKQPYQPTPSMILVSKRTRQEYTPLMLELATISIVVKDFDFHNLRRIISSLYRTELKAIRLNTHLTIHLRAEKCNKDSLSNLRRWLVNRSEGMDRLPWHYDIAWTKNTQIVPTSTQVHRINTYIQRRTILIHNLEAMSQLHQNLDETLRFELQPVIAAYELELHTIADHPVSPWRDEGGLWMWGAPRRLPGT